MEWLQPNILIAVFLIQCRFGACLMIMPGFGSARVSPQIRLFISLAISIALAPILLPSTLSAVRSDMQLDQLVLLIGAELLVGTVIGFIGRAFLAGLQMMGTFAAMSMNLSGMEGGAIEGQEPAPALVHLMTITAVALIFMMGLHWQLVSGLMSSYSVIPPAPTFDAQGSLMQVTDVVREAFLVALQVSSPFVIYAVVVNLALGLANKFTPQIPVYFIAMPFVIAGGLFLTMFVFSEMMGVFMNAFSEALTR